MINKEYLASIPLFSQLLDHEKEEIASIAERKDFLRDTPVFDQQTSGGQLFVVYKGEVKINRVIRESQEQTLAVLRNGDFFGGVSLIDGKEHSASAVCSTDSVIFTIDKSDFDEICRKDPVLGLKILKPLTLSICSYLRNMNTKFIDMVQYVSLAR